MKPHNEPTLKTLDNNRKQTKVSRSLEITVRILNNTKQNCFSDL